VGSRAGMDAVVKRKNPLPRRDSKPYHPGVLPEGEVGFKVGEALYFASYCLRPLTSPLLCVIIVSCITFVNY
jgi:hypothetical protein